MKIVLFFFGLALLPLHSCTPPTVSEPEPVISTAVSQDVFDHHISAFLQNDISALMEDYNDESVVVTPDSLYLGSEQIRDFFEALLPNFPSEGTTIEPDRVVAHNDMVYVIWHGGSPFFDVPFGTDTFIIRDSIIVRQSFAGILNPVVQEAEEE